MNYPQIKPTLNLDFSNTKTLDPRINFRRGTPGAYYDGKTYAKAEENLIDYSEDFSQWGFGRIVQTASQSAPDGSTDAYKIEQESGQTGSGYLLQTYSTSANKSYTFSVYAKAGTNRNYIVLRTFLSNNRFTYFDLVNGEAVNVDDRHVATIQDAGNGWYRCSITYTPISSSSVQFNVYFSDNDSSITVADDGGFIYVWGAQFEQRDSVTAYTPTNGAPITKYQPQLMFASPDQPRFDHDLLTGESKGLLIEESRTNLITYSQQIEKQSESSADHNVWIVSGSSNSLLDLNASIAPDGTLSASKIYADSSTNAPAIYQQIYTTDATPEILTFSVFAKAGQPNRYLQLFAGSGDVDGNPFANFNLFNGTISRDDSSIASIEDHGNGWYRCIITFTTVSTSGIVINPVIYLIDHNAERGVQMTGDGYSGLYIWGAQLETGSFPTSYIKTTGADATRRADDVSITGENFSSWYRQDEGSLFFEASTFDRDDGQARLTISDGTDSNRFYFGFLGSNILKVDSATQGSNIVNYDINFDDLSLGEYHKRSFGLKKDDFAVCINGELSHADTDSSGVIPAVNALHFSTRGVSHFSNSHIKKLSYYPQRLTNEQLQQLTK